MLVVKKKIKQYLRIKQQGENMRFWASWWHGVYEEEGYQVPPFQYWISGQRSRPNEGLTKEQYKYYLTLTDEDQIDEYLNTYAKDDASICAVIDAKNEQELKSQVEKYFPGCEWRFINEKEDEFDPSIGGRFEGFENKTTLY